MTDKFGKRVDVGQVKGTVDGPCVVLEICPYGIMMERRFFCPYREAYKDIELHNCSVTAWKVKSYPEVFRCPMNTVQDNPVCFKVQWLEEYNRANGIHTQTAKEVKEMKITDVKDARCLCGNFVAVDDITEVRLSYLTEDIKKKTDSKYTFKARVVSFEEGCIVLDLSKPFRSVQLDVDYGRLESIKTIATTTDKGDFACL